METAGGKRPVRLGLDYNPTGAEAQAFFNITELAGTFLTKGRRVLLDKFTRMAAHTIVAGTRQQKQRQAMARKYRGVAIFHGAELPPLQQLVAFCRPDKKLASYFSIMGQLSYFCHEKLGRSVTYGDLGYMVHPLSPTERRACSASEHDTVFSVFMEWCQQARDAAAYSPSVIDKYRRTEVKSRSGRDGSEDVVVVAAEYSASTAFNRAKAWQLVVAAYANRVGVRVEDLQQQRLRSSAGSKVEAALAESSKQYAYAKGRLNAAGNIVRAADSDKKSQQRSRSSLDAKKQKQRFAPYDELYDAMEKRRKALNLYSGSWYEKRVQALGEWLLVALHTYVPPLRREMYIVLDVHDVVWDAELNTWCIMVGHFFKNATTAAIDRVLVVESLVEPLAIYLRHRHLLNQDVGAVPEHAEEANRALFVNMQRRRHSSSSMSGVFKSFGAKYLGITAFGPHICRDIFASWYVGMHPNMRGVQVQALAAQMATSVEMLEKHYVHLRGRANARRMQAALNGLGDEVDVVVQHGAVEDVPRTLSVAQIKGALAAAVAAAGARRALQKRKEVTRFRASTKRKASDAVTREEKREDVRGTSPTLLAFVRQSHVDGGGGGQQQSVTAMDIVRYKWTYGGDAGCIAVKAVADACHEFIQPGTGLQLYRAQADALKKFKHCGLTPATGLELMRQVAQVSTPDELASIPDIAKMLGLTMSMRDMGSRPVYRMFGVLASRQAIVRARKQARFREKKPHKAVVA